MLDAPVDMRAIAGVRLSDIGASQCPGPLDASLPWHAHSADGSVSDIESLLSAVR
jgi:hypothetical protein